MRSQTMKVEIPIHKNAIVVLKVGAVSPCLQVGNNHGGERRGGGVLRRNRDTKVMGEHLRRSCVANGNGGCDDRQGGESEFQM
jgi:hypothetical protein